MPRVNCADPYGLQTASIVLSERVGCVYDCIAPYGATVVYMLTHTRRAAANYALLYAQRLALAAHMPLVVLR